MEEEKSAYVEVLDYNRLVSFHDIKRDLKEDFKQGFEFSDMQSTDDKFEGKYFYLRDQDVPDQAVIKRKLRQHKRSVVSKIWRISDSIYLYFFTLVFLVHSHSSTVHQRALQGCYKQSAANTFAQSPSILSEPSAHLRHMRFGLSSGAMDLSMLKVLFLDCMNIERFDYSIITK